MKPIQPRPRPQILIMTVGVGARQDPEATPYTPFRKSIEQGNWNKVVLLPSSESLHHAEEVKRRHSTLDVMITPLAEGKEEDPRSAFLVFEHVLNNVTSAMPEAEIVVDYTRGTKSMSAAIVLAASAHRTATLRYISGRRGDNGTVLPGTEVPHDFEAAVAWARNDLTRAAGMIRKLQFASAVEILEPLSSWKSAIGASLSEEAAGLLRMARFWGAWDRFDYKEADRLAAAVSDLPPSCKRRYASLAPAPEQLAQVSTLAGGQSWTDFGGRCRFAWTLAADVLANAQRRMTLGHYEDCLVRVYRAIEVIGQASLLGHGFDSSAIDPKDPDVIRFVNYVQKKSPRDVFQPNRDGRYEFARERVVRFLKSLGNPIWQKLKDAAEAEHSGGIAVKDRNQSILTHGLSSIASEENRPGVEEALQSAELLFCGAAPADVKGAMPLAAFPFEEHEVASRHGVVPGPFRRS